MLIAIRLLALLGVVAALAAGEQPPRPALLGGRTVLHAHNAYPEKGEWADRIERALATGVSPIVIEQDIAMARRGGAAVPVLSHDPELTGREPSLEDHFFARVRPIMEDALARGDRDRWPLVVLHLDFKTHEPEHHQAVWQLLEKYQRWLTSAPRHASEVMPVARGPLLALTESGPGQEAAFSARERLLIFGSAPPADASRIDDPHQRARALASATPEALITAPATNYRRWVNFSWLVVEEGGQARAGAWTPAEAARLTALATRAHAMGYLLRFYNLNGHPPGTHDEWTAGYNFGSADAVRIRWRAAMAAGVDLLATDQYEELAAVLHEPR